MLWRRQACCQLQAQVLAGVPPAWVGSELDILEKLFKKQRSGGMSLCGRPLACMCQAPVCPSTTRKKKKKQSKLPSLRCLSILWLACPLPTLPLSLDTFFSCCSVVMSVTRLAGAHILSPEWRTSSPQISRNLSSYTPDINPQPCCLTSGLSIGSVGERHQCSSLLPWNRYMRLTFLKLPFSLGMQCGHMQKHPKSIHLS